MNGLVLIEVYVLLKESEFQVIHRENFARIGTFGPCYDPKGGRFPGAISANQSDFLALVYLKGEPPKYLVVPVRFSNVCKPE
jgi:hypothetical protein